eukprot:4789804-Alexandrium_andersonii.AAC.1
MRAAVLACASADVGHGGVAVVACPGASGVFRSHCLADVVVACFWQVHTGIVRLGGVGLLTLGRPQG